MIEVQIEAMLASPPDRDELVVHLFAKDGGQWGEIYRDQNENWIDFYGSASAPMRFRLDRLVQALTRSHAALRDRLEVR